MLASICHSTLHLIINSPIHYHINPENQTLKLNSSNKTSDQTYQHQKEQRNHQTKHNSPVPLIQKAKELKKIQTLHQETILETKNQEIKY